MPRKEKPKKVKSKYRVLVGARQDVVKEVIVEAETPTQAKQEGLDLARDHREWINVDGPSNLDVLQVEKM
jgi:hypothetical protein